MLFCCASATGKADEGTRRRGCSSIGVAGGALLVRADLMAVPFYSIDFRRAEWSAYVAACLLPSGRFRRRLQELLQRRFPEHHVSLFPSARMAFYLLLESLFRPGDELIFPALGFPLYVKIALQLGFRPVLVDVESERLTLHPELLAQAVTPRTRGVIVTHLFGHPAQMGPIMETADRFGLAVIEDAAQAVDSFYRGREAGSFGLAGVYSCSLMKAPTMLGGGVLITRDRDLHARIQQRLADPAYRVLSRRTVRLFVKNLISIINSYPSGYTLLCHPVFGLLKRSNPALLRRILYAGMGLQDVRFDVWERPKPAAYQYAVGAAQFSRARQMTEIRRAHSRLIDERLSDIPEVESFAEAADAYWNRQYHVIRIPGRMPLVVDDMFRKGVHLMKEDVWDCTAYAFARPLEAECPTASRYNPDLVRIPNNSLLPRRRILRIADELKASCQAAYGSRTRAMETVLQC